MPLKIIIGLIYFHFWIIAWGQSNDKSQNINIISNPPGAIIYIEGSIVGITPCDLSFDLVGKYRLRAFKKGYENWKSTVSFGDENDRTLEIQLSSKTRLKAAMRSFILPGWGQTYSDKKIKGSMIKVLQASSIISTLFFEVKYRNAVDNYNDALKNYNIHNKNFDEKDIYWSIVDDKYREVNSSYERRNIFLLTTGAIWLYNILDAIFAFPTYYKQILGENSIISTYKIYRDKPQILISKTFYLD